MKKKRLVAALTSDGRIIAIEQETPPVRPGTVLVEVHNSLVSPGTELGGWRGLLARRKGPQPAKPPKPFGYSNAGVVLQAGDNAAEFKAGDRIACIGVGYAMHTNYAVVPHNLCAALPENVTLAQGSYAMLAATALNALRRGEPQLGEFAAVVGLGLVGQLAAQLYQLAGNYVIGWDLIERRLQIARHWGIDATVNVDRADAAARTAEFTGGRGLDAAVFAMKGEADKAMKDIESCMKRSPDGHPMGRIVVVGGIRFDYTSTLTNIDIRRASRTGAGYHDEKWETGQDYPPVFMRWTTRTNLQLCMRLISEGKLNVDVLTTHTIPLADVERAIDAIIDEPDEILGVVFEC
ncbi:MAG: zinc-dependent alcohol dehydrogenase [Planctomycetota bacterium]|jgi:threonine dehydrogenase-like Zn-dependent dehydrogenase